MVVKMLTELGRRMDEHHENFNKVIENTRAKKYNNRNGGKKSRRNKQSMR